MPTTRPADAEDIAREMGELDDHVIASILEAGPTVPELIEARERVEQNDGLPLLGGEPSSAAVVRVMAVLRDSARVTDAERVYEEPTGPPIE